MMAHVFALLLALADCGLTSGWTLQLERRLDPLQVLLHISNGSTSAAYLPNDNDCNVTIIVKRAQTGEKVADGPRWGCDVYHIEPGYYLAPKKTLTQNLVLTDYGVTSPGSYTVTAQDLFLQTESLGGCITQLKISADPITVVVTAEDLAKEKVRSL